MRILLSFFCAALSFQACFAGTPPAPCGDAEEVDVLIVGGGWAAVMALKTIRKYPTISVKVVEKENRLLGRGVAAHWMNGGIGENIDGTKNLPMPICSLIKEYWPNDFEDYKADWFFGTPTSQQGNYYDTNGQGIPTAEVDSLHTEFEATFKCLRESADDFIFEADATTPDRTFRQVLEGDCGWSNPADGTRRDLAEFIRIDWEWGAPSEKMGLYNLPDSNDVDFGEIGWYLLNPDGSLGSSADVGEKLINDPTQGNGQPLINFMEQGREVQKIYWDNNDGSDFPIRVKTSSETGICADIVTKKVIYTPSIGVLERRGDCKHVLGGGGTHDGCDPSTESIVMFDPIAPKAKMDATRNMYIDEARGDLAGMIEYKEVRFQFKTKFWDSKVFHLFEKEGGRSGCFVWQNLDQDGFYPGSKSVVCTLSTYQWDELADPVTKTLLEDQMNEILNDSFGKLAGGGLNCSEFVPNFLWKPGGASIPIDRDCVYSYFPGWTEDPNNDVYDDWYGSYAVWNLGETQGSLDQDFGDFVAPMVSNGQARVHISGTGICDRHQGYVVGAYYAGIKTAQVVIKELTGIVDKTEQYCDEGPFDEEESSCPCKWWQIFCFILHIFRGCLFHRN